MKLHLIFLLFFSIQLCLCQKQVRIYLDENGNEIDFDTFDNKWRDRSLMFSRWDSIGNDKIRYAKINRNLYQSGKFDYTIIKTELEKIINSKIPENSIILINYRHKDDLCNSKSTNNWSRSKINRRKKWIKPWLKKFDDKKMFHVWLFEKGITLNKKQNQKNELFFIDKSNFFRERIFSSRALCGSTAAIKPNGEILVRNGEGSIGLIYEHVTSNDWNQFFKKE